MPVAAVKYHSLQNQMSSKLDIVPELSHQLQRVFRVDIVLCSVQIWVRAIFQYAAQECSVGRGVFDALINNSVVRRLRVQSSHTGNVVRLTGRAEFLQCLLFDSLLLSMYPGLLRFSIRHLESDLEGVKLICDPLNEEEDGLCKNSLLPHPTCMYVYTCSSCCLELLISSFIHYNTLTLVVVIMDH